MLRESVYVLVQFLAVAAVVAVVADLMAMGAPFSTVLLVLAALLITVLGVLQGLPASVGERLAPQRFREIVLASATRKLITGLAIGMLIVAGAGHAYSGQHPLSSGGLDGTESAFALTTQHGTVQLGYVSGPPLERAALSVLVDGRSVSADPTVATSASGLSGELTPGDELSLVDTTADRLTWTSISVTLRTDQNQTILMTTFTRQSQTPTPPRTSPRAVGTTS